MAKQDVGDLPVTVSMATFPSARHTTSGQHAFASYFKRRSRELLTITESELSAIAAEAMMGFRSPNAAIGTPMLL